MNTSKFLQTADSGEARSWKPSQPDSSDNLSNFMSVEERLDVFFFYSTVGRLSIREPSLNYDSGCPNCETSLHSGQSRTQSPQAFWSAGRRQERLWDNGISYPRKRGIPVLVRMLKIKTEVKCPKMAAVLSLLGLKVL